MPGKVANFPENRYIWNVKRAYIYIITNVNHTVLYTGVTSDLVARIRQHRTHQFGGFSARYALSELIYYEVHPGIEAAIAREKQIKSWRRERKLQLIATQNPTWRNLFTEEDL